MKNTKPNGYELSRQFIDWAFENPEKVNPKLYALYFFIVEHCNRLGWKEKFGLPTHLAMEATGIKNWRTYTIALNQLVEFGFVKFIEKSKNQYTSNIIAIVINAKATTKADTKALDKATSKQSSISVVINKQLNNKTIKLINSNVELVNENLESWVNSATVKIPTKEEFIAYGVEKKPNVCKISLGLKWEAWKENDWSINRNKQKDPIKNWKLAVINTLKYLDEAKKGTSNGVTFSNPII